MAEELKTLKDLKKDKLRLLKLFEEGLITGELLLYHLEQLERKEAIKWVKHWLGVCDNPVFFINKNNCIGFKTKDMDRMNITQRDACVSIGAFVNFFNITKEDLK